MSVTYMGVFSLKKYFSVRHKTIHRDLVSYVVRHKLSALFCWGGGRTQWPTDRTLNQEIGVVQTPLALGCVLEQDMLTPHNTSTSTN